MALFTNALSKAQQERLPVSVTPFLVTVSLPTTALQADDFVLLYQFPNFEDQDVRLTRLGISATDMDTNATPTLVFSVGVGDSDGALDTLLITGTTIGQAGGSAAAVINVPVSVGPVVSQLEGFASTPKFLSLDVTTAAATAAAGSVTVYGELVCGVQVKTGTAV